MRNDTKRAMDFEKLCSYAIRYAEERLDKLDNSIAVTTDEERKEFLEMWREHTIDELADLEYISEEIHQMFYENFC